MDTIKHTKWFLGFSGALVLLSIVAIALFGLRQGIDLRGGTQWHLSFATTTVSESAIRDVFTDVLLVTDASVKRLGEGFLIRIPDVSETQHQEYRTALERALGSLEEQSFSSIGPSVGSELRRKSLWAIFAVLLGISLYIAWAFRKVSEPVRSWQYGLVTLGTLFHDVIIPTGLLAVLGKTSGVEIDTNFIVALLVVMGFSVHDTIVVFDRIRENVTRERGRGIPFRDIVNRSIRETIARSVNTSLTLIIVLIALLFLGPQSLQYFILTMLVGTIFGTYSSIFVASPLLHLWGKRGKV
jgi:preprotein translocase subunit SecF